MLAFILLIIAVILFALAGLGVAADRFNLMALGLAFFAASFLTSTVP